MPPFDPNAPLPSPPEPWQATDMPPLRDGPPYHMTEMISTGPHLARRLIASLSLAGSSAHRLAAAVIDAAGRGEPIVVTGCGTSEHGALATAEILREALAAAGLTVQPGSVLALQAFEAALQPPGGGLVIGISHEGATGATNRSLEAARAAGATTALVTVTDRSPGAAYADIVVTTDELDQGWCHVVGYVSPVLAAAAVGALVSGRPIDPDAAARLLEADDLEEAARGIASALSDVSRLLVVASGADRPAGRELVLKVEEGAWLPSAYRDLETFLHGHLAATDDTTGLVVLLADRHARTERLERVQGVLAAARVIGIRSAVIVGADAAAAIGSDLAPAGMLVVPEGPALPAPVAALLSTAPALQVLTERLARARGINPDPIRRDDSRYRDAAEAAG
jgi:fructoselysine-6-P-deglycase FrlB-like protein